MVRSRHRHGFRRWVLLAALAAAGASLAIASSGAAGRPSKPAASKPLWSTINVCDAQTGAFGVRGQMPGDGTGERMVMRFRAQFRGAKGWQAVSPGGTSPWEPAGSARVGAEQAGFTFLLSPPQPGATYVLRGVVDFEWTARRNGRTVVIRRSHAVTEAGHPGTTGANPKSYSAATCRMAA